MVVYGARRAQKEMSQELSKDTKFAISIETLGALSVAIATLVGMYYALQSDIDEAKRLPPAEVSRTEYDLKDQLIRETIINIEEKVDDNGKKLDLIEQRLYQMQ
jgi:hypothetical protein